MLVRLAGRVIAAHDVPYDAGSGGSCGSSLPAISARDPDPWGLVLLLIPGLCAWAIVVVRRRRAPGWRPAVAAGTAGAFVLAVSVPLPLHNARAASPPSVLYYHGDHLGSAVVVTDASASVLDQVSYEPFGRRTNGPDAPRFGFTGQRTLPEVDLYHFGSAMPLASATPSAWIAAAMGCCFS